jgi:uncharacterized membrane protein
VFHAMRRISPITWVLIAVGLLFVALGIIYFTTVAPDLPSFIPGHVEHVKRARKYSKRGIASIVVAVVAFGAAYYAGWVRTKSASSASASSAEPSV